MSQISLAELERHLFGAADLLRGSMDAGEYRDVILPLFFLKRVNDEFDGAREAIVAKAVAEGCSPEAAERAAETPRNYTDRQIVYVPEEARWARLAGAVTDIGTGYIEPALVALADQEGNEPLRGLYRYVGFHRLHGRGASAAGLADRHLAALVRHFDSLRLRTDDLESPDLLGTAYEYLLKHVADSAGAKGGEFYTPRAVTRMVARLAQPSPGQRVYDPCMGTGGMLLDAKAYVDEHGGDSSEMTLDGQDANSGSWELATLNMLFQGHQRFRLELGDTLTDPRHLDESYDLALSNPPFSMDYSPEHVARLGERMPYGVTPARGKAGLMFLQHMLYMVRHRGGSVFAVMPHGVLFRGGAELSVRRRLVEDDLLEAVIGLAPNLFYGTGIPACVLVLRAPGRKTPERRGKVLFINADREYHPERAQNVLLDEHVEKIVSTFHDFAEVDRFSRVVSREELAENDHNLAILRYVDNTPAPERQDIKAYLEGGVPVAEIEVSRELLGAYGLQTSDLFAVRFDDPAYVDFLPGGERPDGVRLAEMARGREQQLLHAFEAWWTSAARRIAELEPAEGLDRSTYATDRGLAPLRTDLEDSFLTCLTEVGLLDEPGLAGLVVAWWREVRSDIKALSARGAAGVVDDWVRTVETMLTPEVDLLSGKSQARTKEQRKEAYDATVVAVLLPDFVEELDSAEREFGELTAQLREARVALEQIGAGAEKQEKDDDPDVDEPAAAEAVRELRRRCAAAKKAIRTLEDGFLPSLRLARDGLSSAKETQEIVLSTIQKPLATRLGDALYSKRLELVETYERWQEKYLLSFREIEKQLYGHADGMEQNNPWSARRTWNLTSDTAGTAAGRRELVTTIGGLIKAEKTAERALAELEIDELAGTLELARGVPADDPLARRPLGEVAYARSGGVNRTSVTATGVPVIRMSNLTAQGLDLDPSRLQRLGSDHLLAADALLRTGDVLLSAAAVGQEFRVAVWRGQLADATFGGPILCLRPREDLLSGDYLGAWLRLPHVQRRIFQVARTLTRNEPVLSVSRLRDVELELPSISEQRDFGRRIGAWHEQKVVRQRQLAKLRVIREALTSVLTD